MNNDIRTAAALLAFALLASWQPLASAGTGTAPAPTAAASPARIAFTVQENSGNRPTLDVQLGDIPYRMMVHANASFYLQINHATAQRAGVAMQRHGGAYGIEHSGKVSALGRDEGTLSKLGIGQARWHDVPASIFETPGGEVGMLGLQWITASRVVVDFGNNSLLIAPPPALAAGIGESLLRKGYIAIPMRRDPASGRYKVPVTLGGAKREMIVSMVAGLIVDSAFADVSGLRQGAVVDEAGGPNGAVQRTYAFGGPVRLQIGRWQSLADEPGTIYDTYAYERTQRPHNPTFADGGALGADFLIAHRAVVDFGDSMLYLQ